MSESSREYLTILRLWYCEYRARYGCVVGERGDGELKKHMVNSRWRQSNNKMMTTVWGMRGMGVMFICNGKADGDHK